MESINVITLAANSWIGFFRLVGADSLHLRRTRLGKLFEVNKGTYATFRETISQKSIHETPVVLIVGFHLKVIRSNPFFHWFFQRVCILTTPFWSGFRGFRVKLWMVDRETKNYLGIYRWEGEEHAKVYVTALEKVLRPLSTKGSVWNEIVHQDFDMFLNEHSI